MEKKETYRQHYISKSYLIFAFLIFSCSNHQDIKYQDNSLFIVISNSGITPRLVEIVDNAFKNNIDIISFIANENSNLYQNVTLPIIVGSYNSFTHNNLVPNTFFGQVLIVFESLLYTYLSSIE